MKAKRTSDDKASVMTLGDLLYSDRSASVPEHDWVQLVSAIATGDQLALRALYERTHRIVFTLALRICGQREAAEEITLDVFHDVWRRSPQYDAKDGSVIGWVMMLTRSRAIDRVRFDQRKKRVDPDPTRRDDDLDPGSPAHALAAQERRSVLAGALSTLTADERQAIETAFFSELSYAETAERLDQPVGTVKTRVRSALAKLRKVFERKGDDS